MDLGLVPSPKNSPAGALKGGPAGTPCTDLVFNNQQGFPTLEYTSTPTVANVYGQAGQVCFTDISDPAQRKMKQTPLEPTQQYVTLSSRVPMDLKVTRGLPKANEGSQRMLVTCPQASQQHTGVLHSKARAPQLIQLSGDDCIRQERPPSFQMLSPLRPVPSEVPVRRRRRFQKRKWMT